MEFKVPRSRLHVSMMSKVTACLCATAYRLLVSNGILVLKLSQTEHVEQAEQTDDSVLEVAHGQLRVFRDAREGDERACCIVPAARDLIDQARTLPVLR